MSHQTNRDTTSGVLRRAEERGLTDLGWLQSRHTFSFGGYRDPAHMGFRSLRVINDDRVAPGQGFGMHAHQDMEILSYVVEGSLEHRDSLGTGSVVRPGDVQRMTAGTGVRHSEFNPSDAEPVHFLQVWILPERKGLEPAYEQKHFPEEERRGRLRLIASRDGRDNSIVVHQDVNVYAGLLDGEERVELALSSGRHAWVQIIRGSVTLNGTLLEEGDGLALSDAVRILADRGTEAELMVFDLS